MQKKLYYGYTHTELPTTSTCCGKTRWYLQVTVACWF